MMKAVASSYREIWKKACFMGITINGIKARYRITRENLLSRQHNMYIVVINAGITFVP